MSNQTKKEKRFCTGECNPKCSVHSPIPSQEESCDEKCQKHCAIPPDEIPKCAIPSENKQMCPSSPYCSHNTNGRDWDKPCSIALPKEEKWQERFDEKFVRDDGLMDKYTFDEDGDEVFMADPIKKFISSVESAAEQRATQRERERIGEVIEKSKSNIGSHGYDVDYRKGYFQALTDLLAKINQNE